MEGMASLAMGSRSMSYLVAPRNFCFSLHRVHHYLAGLGPRTGLGVQLSALFVKGNECKDG